MLPPSVRARLAVEAGSPQGWHRYVGDRGDVLGVDRFGASAPGDEMLREYGFTVDNVCARARALLREGELAMAHQFKIGDHVRWNSEAGHVRRHDH